jgi:DNA polymerase I-like protein with 3'-5' exonuclease and polymerase domains
MNTDINLASIGYYLANNKQLDINTLYTSAHKFFHRLYWNRDDIADIIPICKHSELIRKIRQMDSTVPEEEILNFKETIQDTFNEVESSGIYTDAGLEYTKYNIFTRTGRPSNSNNNINYAGLNKEDGTRKKYKSRFAGGVLAEFDYDAYHLRLIGRLIKHDLPTGSIHTYFATQFYGTKEITPEEYKLSKKMSFTALYGGIPKELLGVEYFKKTQDYIDKLWNDWNTLGYVETPLLKKKFFKKNFDTMNKQKVFNYVIQSYETETNVIVLKKLLNFLKDKESKIILYIYDAIVFDVSQNDGKQILKDIQKIMDLPTSIHIGRDYHNMQPYTL